MEKLKEIEAKITLSDGMALGKGMKCFNLPNNNCGLVKIKHKKFLCTEGAGREAKRCNNCEFKEVCEKIIICSGATVICNNRCYQNNSLTVETRTVVSGNYMASLQDEFISNMVNAIKEKVIGENIKYFRIHSLGEFYSYKYFCDWMEIAQKLVGEVVFVAYTKCYGMVRRYIEEYAAMPENVKIMLSVMPDSLYGTKTEIESYEYGEEELCRKRDQNIVLIKDLMNRINADIYFTTYDDAVATILKEGNVDWFQETGIQECNLHNGMKCTECIKKNGDKGGCYLLKNKSERNRIIIEKIRVTSGKADYISDIKRVGKYNEKLATLLIREIKC